MHGYDVSRLAVRSSRADRTRQLVQHRHRRSTWRRRLVCASQLLPTPARWPVEFKPDTHSHGDVGKLSESTACSLNECLIALWTDRQDRQTCTVIAVLWVKMRNLAHSYERSPVPSRRTTGPTADEAAEKLDTDISSKKCGRHFELTVTIQPAKPRQPLVVLEKIYVWQ